MAASTTSEAERNLPKAILIALFHTCKLHAKNEREEEGEGDVDENHVVQNE
eukprot:m.9127 g.9127  ORF g.9127 m.9127 type:complete len:51 (-) comp5403_c0_seq1:15-167(-)